jgi:hypothetical protein
MQIQVVTFSEAKDGNAPDEWQDGASGGVAGDATGMARFIVVDGATGSFDPLRWVDQLVTSFVPPPGAKRGADHAGPAGPRLEPAAMRAWFAQMQDQWAADVPAFDSIIEERKFREVGSFATFLGFEITGLDGPEPFWRAVALGDTVLFHVRAGRLIATFPPMRPGEFGSHPAGVHTLRSSLDQMTERLLAGGGVLATAISFSRPPTRWRTGSCGPPDATRPRYGTPWPGWYTPMFSPAWSRINAKSRTALRG